MIARLRDLLAPALAGRGVDVAGDLFAIGDAWETALGEGVAAHSAPVGLRRGELVVAAPEAVWRQELSLLAPDIKAKINRALGRDAVSRVRIVAGEAFGPGMPRIERRGAGAPARGGAAAQADDAAAPDPWPELRAPEPVRNALSALHRARGRRLLQEARRGR